MKKILISVGIKENDSKYMYSKVPIDDMSDVNECFINPLNYSFPWVYMYLFPFHKIEHIILSHSVTSRI